MEVLKKCARCKQEQPIRNFGLARKKPKSYCRPCESARGREWYAANRDDINLKRNRDSRARTRYEQCRKDGICPDCGASSEGHIYCPIHRKERMEKEILRRANRPPRICRSCKQVRAPFGRSLCEECSDNRGARFHALQKRYRDAQKLEAFQRYGGAVCACCEESEFGFLTIDHINDDGAEHRRAIFEHTKHGRGRLYVWLKRHNYPAGFRVLCFNCNCGRQYNGGICPHKQVAT